ncbi:hypothetical protein LTR97_000600 [Elasticomyces elasticus]|uniref:Uncharacterized protein n=1 Tax=Elasticomyces elasticus TaxID=574655 RepID=A0AAN7WKG9_9PEZI|nr:hypothetical protein LTR97_000600 [Elasticomyces elasticus]
MPPFNSPSIEWAESRHQRTPIHLMLKGVPQYPAKAEARVVMLADLIDFIWTSQGFDTCMLVDVEEQFWFALLDTIEWIPPDHECQNSIIQALCLLCQREPNQIGQFKSEKKVVSASAPRGWEYQYLEVLWTDFPGLGIAALKDVEGWSSPVEMIPEPSGEEPPPTSHAEQLARFSKRPESSFVKYANLHSFFARFAGTGFGPQWVNFAIWMLRAALEEPAVEGKRMSYRLWIATEWLVYFSNRVFEFLTSGIEIEVNDKSLRTGQLCKNVPWLGVERWNYWKTRAASVAEALDDWQGDGPFANRIALTLECMARAEEAAIARGSVNSFTPSPAAASSVLESSTTAQPDTSSTSVPTTDTPTEVPESSIPCTATPSPTAKPKQRRWWLW